MSSPSSASFPVALASTIRVRTAPDVELEVDLYGDPEANLPVVVLLHGFPEGKWMWRKLAPTLAEAGFRVLAPALRGYGRSSKPPKVADYGIDLLAQDVLALLEPYADQPIYVMGHDWGGALAWHLALTRPEQFAGLVVVNMPHPLVMQQTLRRKLDQQLRSWYALFFQLRRVPEFIMKQNRFQVLKFSMLRSARPHTFSPDYWREAEIAWSQPGALKAMLNWYRAVVKHPYDYRGLGYCKPPTLILWGEQDAFLGTYMAEPSRLRCANAELHLQPEGTHWVLHEKPEWVQQRLLDFLQRQQDQGAEA